MYESVTKRLINREKSAASQTPAPPLRSGNRDPLRADNHPDGDWSAARRQDLDANALGSAELRHLSGASRTRPTCLHNAGHDGEEARRLFDRKRRSRAARLCRLDSQGGIFRTRRPRPGAAVRGGSRSTGRKLEPAEGVGDLFEDRRRSTRPGSHRRRDTGLSVPEPRLADALCRRHCRRGVLRQPEGCRPSTSSAPTTLRLAFVKANRLVRRVTTSSSPEPSSWRWSS
jgi:hypothetical protein